MNTAALVIRVALVIIAEKVKIIRMPDNYERVNKICLSHVIEYYSAIKTVHATTWMNLENLLNERT